jgi:hypothetical protein
MQVKTVQYGLGTNGPKSDVTGEWVCGSETLKSETLLENRCRFGNEIYAHPLEDDYHRIRSAIWSKINIPLLTAANWGGQGLHLRGNFEGFSRAESEQKWLEVHGLEHWTEFYTDYGVKLQKRFFNHFLKNENNGWEKQPRVQLQVRRINGFEERHHNSWPIEDTEWTRFYLSSEDSSLSSAPPKHDSKITFSAMEEGVNFLSPPLESETEITGPSAVKLFISSSTVDADFFVVLRIFSPADEELVFQGAIDPYTPIGQGWLRASHRKLDPILSEPWRPYHTHDELWPLNPGEPEMLDIEIWPTSIVVPVGYRIGLSIRGKDYEYPDAKPATLSNFKNKLKGCGPFLHNDPRDRPEKIFSGDTTLYFGPDQSPYLLLPLIPKSNH